MTEAALTAQQAQDLARAITGNRLAVAAVYDGIAARIGPDLPDFKTVALGLHDPAEAFAAALMSTGRTAPPWHRAFLTELTAQGLIDPVALERLTRKPGGISILPQKADGTPIDVASFSAMMSPSLKMADLMYAFSLAARRLCQITIAGPTANDKGTGFLVGPQTVLTNFHVVASLIDPVTGKAMPGSASRLTCKFETLTDITGRSYAAADDWLIDFSPVNLNPGPAVAGGPKQLDYCAIRLKGAPGRERGWYDLTKTGALDAEGDAFFVFQHPYGLPQRAGFATHTRLDDDPDFLRHGVATSPGSSGGLCLDNRLRPIAMHQGALLDDGGLPAAREVRRKRAIRLQAIQEAARDIARADPQHDRISQLADKSTAVIGRDGTQSTLRLMAEGRGTYILIVRGPTQSGKTFSARLLEGSIPDADRVIITLQAGQLPADARDLARMILSQAGMAEAEITMALASQATLTTTAATVADVFAILKRALQGIAAAGTSPGKRMWLVIDDLDKVQLPQIGARTLLDHIYNDAELPEIMRIVLIGLTDTLVNVEAGRIAVEPLADPAQVDQKDIEDCLGRLMTDSGKATSAEAASLQARIVSYAAAELQNWPAGSNTLTRVSSFLASVYMKAIR